MELDVERDVADDELVPAIARALRIDLERLTITSAPATGDFARHVRIEGAGDSIAFYRALASLLDTRLLVDDAEGNQFTAMLVSSSEAVRVNIDENRVIVGLHEHVYSDDIPDRLVPETTVYRRTRGAELAKLAVPADLDTLMAAYPPDVQDAQHQLTELLRELVHRCSTPDDNRVLRRTSAVLHRAFSPEAVRAGSPELARMFVADILRCADVVLAAPWDPEADA